VIFQQISVDSNRAFGYYICDETDNAAVFVDPWNSPEKFLVIAEEMGASVQYVINTHNAEGQSAGNAEILKRTKAKLIIWSGSGRRKVPVSDDMEIEVGNTVFRFIHAPGRSADSMCVLVERNLLSGDSLLVGQVGRTDTKTEAKRQFKSLHKLTEKLADDINIFPGYDVGVRPFSTIRYEKDNNPFLNTKDFNEFVFLKNYWKRRQKPGE
jgi:hydroxyacylglutathione hydrolase